MKSNKATNKKVEVVKMTTLNSLINKRRDLFKKSVKVLVLEYLKDTGFGLERIDIIEGKKDKIEIDIVEYLK